MNSATDLQVSNPLFRLSGLPCQFPPFAEIRNIHYLPAFLLAMQEQIREIAEIADQPEPPDFQNTLVALERSGQLLDQVTRIFFNLNGAHTNAEMDAISRQIAPKLAAHQDAIKLNSRLFARIAHLHKRADSLQLDAESRYLLQRYYTDFVRAGAQLGDVGKTRLKHLNSALASLSIQFSQNVLQETNALALQVGTEDLQGLSSAEIANAAQAANVRELDGQYVLALANTTNQPYAAHLAQRDVRRRLHRASIQRGCRGGAYDNRAIALQIARLRAEKARLLGYDNWAAYTLEDETAGTTDAVNNMLARLVPAAIANAKKEAAQIQQMINAQHGNFELAACDWSYYAEQVRKQEFDLDQAQLSPYFELDNVLLRGVFYAATRLYGLQFSERHDLPLYDDSVRVFEVRNEDGSMLALFIADMYARENKRGGAWMSSYVQQSALFGTLPVVANHMNIPKPPAGQPTLLTPAEVRTAFHEFGHALHGMFSQVRYPRFSGTNVPRDFVEFPSQVNEMWATDPQVLTHYARHYQTGEIIPAELLEKLLACKKFNQGFATTEYLAASLLDQAWHQLSADQIPDDVLAFETQSLQLAGVDFAPVPPRYRSTYFSHIFASAYAASYYAYLWSEILDADSVEWFAEHGGLTRENGDWFRQQVLCKGGSIDAVQAYLNFRGREPQIAPLLERRGLSERT
jgi:peptidyl-dipeptidase Dcp